MVVVVVLLTLLVGTVGHVTLGGRAFSLSPVDTAALGVFVVGARRAWWRGWVRLDAAVWAYLALLGVVLVQLVALPDQLEVLGGASRLVTPLLIVLGASQLAVDGRLRPVHSPGRPRRWLLGFAVFGAALAVPTVWAFLRAAADPAHGTFYAIKDRVVVGLGASNHLASFLLAATVIAAVVSVDRRHPSMLGRAAGPAAAAGLVATLSRGAAAALALTAVAALAGGWRRVAAIGRVTAIAASVVVGLVLLGVGATTAPRPSVAAAAADGRSVVAETPSLPPGVEAAAPQPAGPSGLWLARTQGALRGEVAGRVALARRALDAAASSPAIGVGLNRFDRYSATSTELGHDHAHNLALHVLAELGVLGVGVYVGLWALLVWRIVRLPAGVVRAGLGLGTLAVLLHAQVDTFALTRGGEVVLALLLVTAGAAPSAVGVRVRHLGTATTRG